MDTDSWLDEFPPPRAAHDLGGATAGPIDTTDRELVLWEKQVNALSRVVQDKGFVVTDEIRRSTERIDAIRPGMGYFEKTIFGLANLLIEKGVIEEEELQDELRNFL